MALAFGVEALLVLVVVSLGSSWAPPMGRESGLVSVRFKADADKPDQAREEKPRPRKENSPRLAAASAASSAAPARTAPPVAEPRPAVPAPQIVPLSPSQKAAADFALAPKTPPGPPAPGRPMMGPPGPPAMPDTPRVSGSGPNGEPLYAAAWYREPYDDELRGYLSTATGPGWGLIACRTAPDYRVEDCVAIDEFPNGSNIARAVLAAAWQFKVRPPRIGGQPRIGEWVRIRIDYQQRRK